MTKRKGFDTSARDKEWKPVEFTRTCPVPDGVAKRRRRRTKTNSLCFICATPTGECPWLLYKVPFEGSRIVQRDAPYPSKNRQTGEICYKTYRMDYCPMFTLSAEDAKYDK